MGTGRKRLDDLLVARGLARDAAHAKALVMAGKVVVGGHRRDKPGDPVAIDAEIALKADKAGGWASRGAGKLLGALDAFPEFAAAVEGARCLDIGASTGGFTDVLLRHGAAHVVALDVGYGQLHWRLRSDDRVTTMDRTNIRHVGRDDLAYRPEVITCDASFIALSSFVGEVAALAAPGAWFVALVKPQFELPRDQVGEGGVVRDPTFRALALELAVEASRAAGFEVVGAVDSPVAGPKGNREFLLALRAAPDKASTD